MRMKRMTILAAALLAAVLLPVLAGCSGGTPEETVTHGDITVNYIPTFEGENAAGFSRLDLAVTISNDGDASFALDPQDFTVMVNDYTYVLSATDLAAADIAAGDSVTGMLSYEVPPTAKISGTGFKLVYGGPSAVNVWLVRGTPTATIPKGDPYVTIHYNLDWVWIAAPGTEYLKVDPPGNMYLAVEMFVENHGYESFNTNADYFSVTASSLEATYDSPVEEEIIDWRDLDIQDGGSFIGTLMFNLPSKLVQSFYQWNYDFHYAGLRNYNIRWVEQIASKYFADYQRTEFPGVLMEDGDTVDATLVYQLAETLNLNGMVVRMLYEEMDPNEFQYNVQWVDQPGLEIDVNRDPVAPPVIKVTYATQLTTFPDSTRTYMVVHVTLENRGYPAYLPDPSTFFLEVLSTP